MTRKAKLDKLKLLLAERERTHLPAAASVAQEDDDLRQQLDILGFDEDEGRPG